MKFTIFQGTRTGARPYNQDRLGQWGTGEALLMALADGMGGHLRGELAAQFAVEAISTAFRAEAKPGLADPEQFVFNVIGRAHSSIIAQAARMGLPESPRTTVVACIVQDGFAYWNHIGDSRLYLIRNGRVAARTRDHTRVQQLIDQGRIREEAAATHPDRNKLLQCLGSEYVPRLGATETMRLAKGDIVMLCSDGLWGPLTQRQILHAYMTADVERATNDLMALAEARAGQQCDNVSVVAMRWDEEEIATGQSPRTLPNHEMPTDVQDFTATDPEFLRMSDAEFDKAVDEIRIALNKNKPA
jgi:serine/threonine protein phosphatase PrpC